jgi:hypothetical protein
MKMKIRKVMILKKVIQIQVKNINKMKIMRIKIISKIKMKFMNKIMIEIYYNFRISNFF